MFYSFDNHDIVNCNLWCIYFNLSSKSWYIFSSDINLEPLFKLKISIVYIFPFNPSTSRQKSPNLLQALDIK